MLHSTYLETSRLESSMHPNFTKAMQGRCQGIYQRIWLYLTKYLYFNYLKLAMIKRFPLLIMLMVWCIAFGNLKSVHGPCAKKHARPPTSKPCCCNLTAIRVASRCLICLELQSGLGILQNSAGCHRMKKLHRGHFDSTEKKNTSFFVGFLRCVAAIAGHCTIDSCIDSCFSAFLKAYSASS